MELQRMFVTLALRADEFKNGVNAAAQHAEGFRGRVEGAFSKLKLVAAGAMAAIGAAIVAGFAMAIKNSIEVNAQLETTTLQFETLMGSADKASEHVADLFEFAERTPFETGPIIDASLKLETFGGAALNTMENITLLGDAAAATNAPIDELGFWVGRLYANLQAGQPFGEAAMRLQELAVMSPQARQEMEALQKQGASAGEVFAVFQGDLERFTGSMEKQASTWQGLVATAKDQISLLLADALAPVFETAKEGMMEIIALLNDPGIQKGIKAMGEGLSDVVDLIAEAAAGLLQMTAGLGQHGQNQSLAEALGLDPREFQQFMSSIMVEEGLGLESMIPGTAEYLELTLAVNAAIRERYAAEIMLLDGINARSEAEDWATEKQAQAVEEMNRQAESADRVMLSYQNTARDSEWLARATDMVNEAQARATAETEARVASIQAEQAALAETAAAVETITARYAGLVEQYTTTLPGATEALVSSTAALAGEQAGLAVNVGGVKQAIFDQLVEARAAPEVIAAYGVAVGIMTEAQARAALAAAAVQIKIEELAKKIAEGMPVDAALEDLDSFIYKLEDGVVPAVTTTAQEVLEEMDLLNQGVAEEARQIGESLMVGLSDSINENKPTALNAATLAAEELINETKGIFLIESPSRVFYDIGDNLMAGLGQGLEETYGAVVEQMKGIGSSIMDGLISGIDSMKESLSRMIQGVADSIPQWVKDALGIRSPAREMIPLGVAIVDGLIAGIEEREGTLQEKMESLFAFASSFGGLAGGFGRRFAQTVLDPLESQLDGLDEQIESHADVLTRILEPLGLSLNQPDLFPMLLRYANSEFTTPEFRSAALTAMGFLDEYNRMMMDRNELNDEFIAQQQTLLRLQQAQADLDFLKTQMELIDLVRENADSLPAGILSGIEFGLYADPAALMGAMVSVMEQLVFAASDELAGADTLNRATPGTVDKGSTTIQNQNITGGMHNYFYDTDMSELEELGILSR